jgi:hypothetical protein
MSVVVVAGAAVVVVTDAASWWREHPMRIRLPTARVTAAGRNTSGS